MCLSNLHLYGGRAKNTGHAVSALDRGRVEDHQLLPRRDEPLKRLVPQRSKDGASVDVWQVGNRMSRRPHETQSAPHNSSGLNVAERARARILWGESRVPFFTECDCVWVFLHDIPIVIDVMQLVKKSDEQAHA